MITNYDMDEATFKAGYSFAQSGLDINTAWEKFCEVNEQIKKNVMKHPITGVSSYQQLHEQIVEGA